MKIVSLKSLLLAAGLTAIGVSFASAQSTGAVVNAAAPTVRPVMPALPSDLQALFDKFAAERATIMANRKTALDALKAATTDAQRKTIIDALHAQNATLLADQRALGRQIRDQMRTLRKNQPKPGGG